MKVIFSETATRSLDSIESYISRNSTVEIANKQIATIVSGVEIMGDYPRVGAKLKGDAIRFVVIGKYIAVYKIFSSHILITEIYSKGQNWR